ncbi:SoxR reducing system RseC family protein [Viridibacterium curvum]|uniref:Fis family transcriptional regulator n=1 Tax=Viridibacterium curvum TaxID=1101404 RepID=A0ABP9R624_9RHOO
MSTTQGRIVGIVGNSVELAIAEQSGCGSCRSKSSCGVGTTRAVVVDDLTLSQLRQGDKVEISMPTAMTLGLAAALYIPPALGFLLGTVIATAWGAGDSLSLLAGLAGLVTGFFAARRLTTLLGTSPQPEIRPQRD